MRGSVGGGVISGSNVRCSQHSCGSVGGGLSSGSLVRCSLFSLSYGRCSGVRSCFGLGRKFQGFSIRLWLCSVSLSLNIGCIGGLNGWMSLSDRLSLSSRVSLSQFRMSLSDTWFNWLGRDGFCNLIECNVLGCSANDRLVDMSRI